MSTKILRSYTRLPDAPTPALLEQYRRDGYLAFEDVLTADEVTQASDGINTLVKKYAFQPELAEHVGQSPYARALKNGRGQLFKSKTSDFHFQLEGGYDPSPDRLDEMADHIRKFQSYVNELPIYDFIANRHPALQKLLKAILGDDCRLYSSMALCKPAKMGGEKPWHQDLAYFSVNRFDGMCGVWIALDHATVDNGCMHVIPGAHRTGPRRHYWSKVDCEIATDEVDESNAVAVELKPGSLMIFDGMLPHETPANVSAKRRRALQFHYQSAATQVVPRAEYEAQFTGANGLFAGCDYSLVEADKPSAAS